MNDGCLATAPELRLPHEVIVNANQRACLELRSHALEFFARAFGIAVEHALAIELVAPSVELNDYRSGRQLEVCRRRIAAAGRTFVERRER
jgi:hypothetical protein